MNKNIDIKNIKTAKRYAIALSQSAKGNLEEINNDLALVDETIFQNEELKSFFSHPVISLHDKKETIKTAFENKINEKTLNFICTLLDEGRFLIFKTIFELFKKQKDIIENSQKIDVVSVLELDDNQKERLKEKLTSKLQKQIILNYQSNKDILGGLVIKFEDKVIDLSLKTKFDKIKNI